LWFSCYIFTLQCVKLLLQQLLLLLRFAVAAVVVGSKHLCQSAARVLCRARIIIIAITHSLRQPCELRIIVFARAVLCAVVALQTWFWWWLCRLKRSSQLCCQVRGRGERMAAIEQLDERLDLLPLLLCVCCCATA
jgi:hypothetical protein